MNFKNLLCIGKLSTFLLITFQLSAQGESNADPGKGNMGSREKQYHEFSISEASEKLVFQQKADS
ncbi:MAG: hypothetical protein H7X84_03705 [Verrucomicrobia bacterium]|nr:hypothetical protein [Prolixibacteraceae bacterium]